MPLLQGQSVRLGNDRNDIDDLCELLQDDDINLLVSYSSRPAESATYRLQGVAGRVDEEETAVDPGIGDMFISERSKLLSQVGRVLVLDLLGSAFGRPTPNACSWTNVFHNRVPAVVVVDLVSVARGVDDVQPQPDSILNNDYAR